MTVKTRKRRHMRAHRTDRDDAIDAVQVPGATLTLEMGAQKVTVEDPRIVCLRIAQEIEIGEGDEHEREDAVWPHDAYGDPLEFQIAGTPEDIADALIRDVLRVRELSKRSIGYLYRNKHPWEEKGRPVLGKLVKPSGTLQFFSAHDFLVLINWPIWQLMTPWQKVALVYHELRHADENEKGRPSTRGHDFEGFFDELEIFGTQTYADWARLGEAATRGELVTVQYHLPFAESNDNLGAEDEEA